MSTNNYHHGDVRNSIIFAGIDIISEQGVQNLSIRNAAKKIGVSHTAPYRHFKNKEELLVAIAIKGFDILEQDIDKALSGKNRSGVSTLVDMGNAYIKFAISNSHYYRIFLSLLVLWHIKRVLSQAAQWYYQINVVDSYYCKSPPTPPDKQLYAL